MPGPLTRYAIYLSEHPFELERFLDDAAFAREAMKAAGLNDKQQDALLSGNSWRVRDELIADSRTSGIADVDVPGEIEFMEVKIHLFGRTRPLVRRERAIGPPLRPSEIRLSIVGTGTRAIVDTAPGARVRIAQADLVYYVLAEPLARAWVNSLNPNGISLQNLYALDKSRTETYDQIVATIMSAVDEGKRVCFVTAGHPGFFSYAAHVLADRLGRTAEMLAAISSQDSGYSDLGLDPGDRGLQTFEATQFMRSRPAFEPRSALMLLQIGAIDIDDVRDETRIWNPEGLCKLAALLAKTYGSEHPVALYDAARYAFTSPVIRWTTLGALDPAAADIISTMYVPAVDSL